MQNLDPTVKPSHLLVSGGELSVLMQGGGAPCCDTKAELIQPDAPRMCEVGNDGSNPISSKSGGHIAVQSSCFGRWAKSVTTCALGALLVLSAGGCATAHRAGGHIGVPVASSHVTMAPQAYDIQLNAPEVKAAHDAMVTTIKGMATPPMAMLSSNPFLKQTRAGSYKKNIIPEYVLEQGAHGKITIAMLLPVSGHVGDSYAETQANARLYSEIDRHRVWIEFEDGTKKVLIDNLDPKGDMVAAARFELDLPPGKHRLVWSPLPEDRTVNGHFYPAVSIYGFESGRAIEMIVK